MEDFNELPSGTPEPVKDRKDLVLMLFGLAFCLFLFAQISNLSQAAANMKWQANNLERQIEALTESETRFADLIKQREVNVQQSQQVQSQYTNLLADLLELSESDADAQAVVQKFNIQRQEAPPAAPSEKTP
jgi:cell shape-determining protein MreC